MIILVMMLVFITVFTKIRPGIFELFKKYHDNSVASISSYRDNIGLTKLHLFSR